MIDYKFNKGNGHLLTTAIHEGHFIRHELLPYFNLTDLERLREEDPYTGFIANICEQNLVVNTSRFETDVNRPPEKAIYIQPEDAWGLELYRQPLKENIIENSRANYAEFYEKMVFAIDSILQEQEWLVVYDLHSYNHRREGFDRYASPHENPEINIGTGNTSAIWQPVVNTLIDNLKNYNFQGRYLDVRENVKFQGGYFSKWLSENFGDRVCPIAIEFKKFFMNEWTGEVDKTQLYSLRQMLINSIEPVLEAAHKVKK